MVSGNDPSEDDRNAFFQAGAEDFWVKPVSAQQIESLTAGCVTGCHMPGSDLAATPRDQTSGGGSSREKWT